MSNYVQERYNPKVLAANSVSLITANGVGGFLCVASGTLAIASNDQTPRTIVAALPVVAGTYYPMPFQVGINGFVVTLSGGAAGTLGIS